VFLKIDWDSAYLHQGTSYQCRDMDPDLYLDPLPGLAPKFNHFFTDPLPTFYENFMQIRLEVFCANLLTDRHYIQTTMTTQYISSLAKVTRAQQ